MLLQNTYDVSDDTYVSQIPFPMVDMDAQPTAHKLVGSRCVSFW